MSIAKRICSALSHLALYRLRPNARGTRWHQSALYSFCSAPNCIDGTIPAGSVIVDSAGHLFGTTTNDENEGGVVFELAEKNGNWQETVLHTFCCGDGYLPEAGVMIGPGRTPVRYECHRRSGRPGRHGFRAEPEKIFGPLQLLLGRPRYGWFRLAGAIDHGRGGQPVRHNN
jgi:hypothetical protein